MRPSLLATALVLAGAAAAADGLSTDAPNCGGDAFSRGEVVEHRPARRGPLTTIPDTLCADLAPQHEPTRVDIYANPIITPQNDGRNGSGGGSAPYPGRAPLGGPPRPYRD